MKTLSCFLETVQSISRNFLKNFSICKIFSICKRRNDVTDVETIPSPWLSLNQNNDENNIFFIDVDYCRDNSIDFSDELNVINDDEAKKNPKQEENDKRDNRDLEIVFIKVSRRRSSSGNDDEVSKS